MVKIPEKLNTFLTSLLTENEKLLGVAQADRDLDGSFKDIILAFTEKRLMFFFGDREKAKVFRGFINRSKLPEIENEHNYGDYTYKEFDISEAEGLEITDLVAAGMLCVSVKGEALAVCTFTNAKSGEVGSFAGKFNKFKETGEVPEDDGHDGRKEACPKCGTLYPDPFSQKCPRCSKTKKTGIMLRLLKMAGKYKLMLFAVYIPMTLSILMGMIVPYLSGTVLYDNVLNPEHALYGKVLPVIGLIVLCSLISMVLNVVNGILNVKLSARVVYDIKTEVFGSMQRLSLSYFLNKQTGNLMTRVNSDASSLHYFFVDGLSYMFTSVVQILVSLVILLILDWQLTLLCIIPIAMIIFYLKKRMRKLDVLSWRQWRRTGTLNSAISDTVKGTRVIKAFGREKQEIKRFDKVNYNLFDAQYVFNKNLATILPINTLILNAGSLIIWAFGGAQIISGVIQFGVLVSFVNYIGKLHGSVQHLTNIINWWSNCMTSAQRIFEIMDAPAEVKEPENPVEMGEIKGAIKLDDISFGYEPNKFVIKNVSVDIKPDTMIGVVGHSGAGKSTLVNLISRLYDVNEGKILIDGVNVKDISSADLRKNIGIVSQEVYVFMGTIAENIAYAKPDCTREELINAAKAANAHDFIEKLPDGYDTFVGVGGQDLSGGEKQRISIARAILHNPRILILDEATASLDTETERQIQEALEKLIEGRTTIAIAHRLSTLRNADFIVVMDGGRVIEQGEHMELIRNKGEYFRQVSKQTEALKVQGVGE